MSTRNITRTGQVSSCYFRTTADGGARKALVQIDERCNLHCAHCFVPPPAPWRATVHRNSGEARYPV
jgi:hypothetical protein